MLEERYLEFSTKERFAASASACGVTSLDHKILQYPKLFTEAVVQIEEGNCKTCQFCSVTYIAFQIMISIDLLAMYCIAKFLSLFHSSINLLHKRDVPLQKSCIWL